MIPILLLFWIRFLGFLLGVASVLLLEPLIFVNAVGLFGMIVMIPFIIVPYGLTIAVWSLFRHKKKNGRGP